MLKVNLQLFAHKKGGGSTSNGRDSQAKRLVLNVLTDNSFQVVQFYTVNVVQKSIQVKT